MRRLDPDRDVSDADLMKIVEAATKGPSGSNAQPLRWLVVKDADKRRRLGEIYLQCWLPVFEMYKQRDPDGTNDRVMTSADYLGHHMGDAPAIIIPCTKDGAGLEGSSVYGCVQNLFLAARALGLGTTLTTIHRFREAEVREVLGIPEDVSTWALIPVGHPLGRWAEAKRRPVGEVTYWDTWKNAPPTH